MATTQTPILCPQCSTQVAILENLPQDNPDVRVTCSKCGLGLDIDTTVYSQEQTS